MTMLYRKLTGGGRASHSKQHQHNNPYIEERGEGWVVLNKKGEVLSHHETREKAEESFRAMEMHKHG